MASEPSQIRASIEHTRSGLGDTVQALAHKADIKGRARHKVKQSTHRGPGSAHHVMDKVAEVTRPVAHLPGQVASHKKVVLPLAGLAGAGSIFFALRAKNNHSSRG